MKKIIISIAALCSTIGFAGEISGVHHRLEAGLGVAFQFDKDLQEKGIQKATYIGATYIPEFDYEINEKIGLTFGPRVNFGVETNIQKIIKAPKVVAKTPGTSEPTTPRTATAAEVSGAYGIKGGIGAELDVNFRIPEGEVVYLGFDANVSGLGYVGKELEKKDQRAGFATDFGISVGGKIGEKVKIGGRLGYEFEGLYAKKTGDGEKGYNTTIEPNHNLTVGLRFGYRLGE